MRVAHRLARVAGRSLLSPWHVVVPAGSLFAFGILHAVPATAQPRVVSAIGQQIGEAVSVGVDAGAAAVAYDDYSGARVATLTPSVRWESARAMVVANASLSQFETGHTSLQSGVAGSLLSPEFLNLRAEAYGTFSTTRYLQSLAATNVYGVGRLHAAGANGGAWVGAGGGFVSVNSGFPRSVTMLDAGLWARDEGVQYTVTVLPTRVGDWSYADITGAVRWEGPRSELAFSTGYRARPSDSIPGVQAWAEAWLTVWLGRRLAVVTGAGVFPFDAVQGLPGGRYASAGLRVVTRRARVGDPALRAELTEPYELRRLARSARGRVAIERFQVTTHPDGTRELRLRIPGARHVELMADFTEWNPVALSPVPASEDWCIVVPIGPGMHRVNVRVDDHEWEVPIGLTSVRDEYGGAVGLLVVR